MIRTLLHNDADIQTVTNVRFIIFGLCAILVWLTPITGFSILPAEIFEPWGVWGYLYSFLSIDIIEIILSYPFLLTLKSILILCCFISMIGTHYYKVIPFITLFLLFMFDSIVKGFNGYINHAELVTLYSAFIYCLFPRSFKFSFIRSNNLCKIEKFSVPIVLTCILVCLTYAFVGIHRLIYGGIEIFTNDALLNYVIVNSLNYSKYGFSFGFLLFDYPLLLAVFKAGFFVVTIMEVLSPFILIYRYLRYTWLVVMIPFHVLSLFTMNIFFWENLILIIVLFIDWKNMNWGRIKRYISGIKV